MYLLLDKSLLTSKKYISPDLIHLQKGYKNVDKLFDLGHDTVLHALYHYCNIIYVH